MFVVQYDLSDMPSNSQSFIRQKTYYLPKSITSTSGTSESDGKPFTAAGSNKIPNQASTSHHNQTASSGESSPASATSLNSSNKRNSTSNEHLSTGTLQRPASANGQSAGNLANGKAIKSATGKGCLSASNGHTGKSLSSNGHAAKSLPSNTGKGLQSTNGQSSSNGLAGKSSSSSLPSNLTASLSTTDLSANLPTNLTAKSKSSSSKSYTVSSSSKEVDEQKLCRYQFKSSFLRYLIHLRFLSTKSGKIYLHRDIRILILKKNEFDPGNLSQTPTYHWVTEQITEITEAASSKYSLR